MGTLQTRAEVWPDCSEYLSGSADNGWTILGYLTNWWNIRYISLKKSRYRPLSHQRYQSRWPGLFKSCWPAGLRPDRFPSPLNPTTEATFQTMAPPSCWCSQLKLRRNEGSAAVNAHRHDGAVFPVFPGDVLLTQWVTSFPEKLHVAQTWLLCSQWLFIQAAPDWRLRRRKVLPPPSVCSKFPLTVLCSCVQLLHHCKHYCTATESIFKTIISMSLFISVCIYIYTEPFEMK